MPVELPVTPPDISAILTSLGILSLAIAAVVGGIYKGIKEVTRGGADTDSEVKSAVLVETTSLRALTESNLTLVQSNNEMRDNLKHLCRVCDHLVETMKDHREIVRSQMEEQHRLRAATVDLVEVLRRRS